MFQACFHCELLFELDRPATGPVPCPQCRAPLSDYEPEADFQPDESEDVSAVVPPSEGFRGPVYDMTRMSRVIQEEGPTEMMSSSAFAAMMSRVEAEQVAARRAPVVPGDDEPTNLVRVDSNALAAIVDPAGRGAAPVPNGATGPNPQRRSSGRTGPVPAPKRGPAPSGSTGPIPRRRSEAPAPAPAPPPAQPRGPVPARRDQARRAPRPASAPPPAADVEPDYGGAYGSYFDARAVVDQPDAIDAIVGAQRAQVAQAPPPLDRPPPVRRRKRGVLPWIWLTLGLSFAGLIAYMVVTRTRSNEGGAELAPTASTPAAERNELERAVREAEVALPEADGVAAPEPDAAWLAAGPEKLAGSVGPIPGLTSMRVSEGLTKQDGMGTWIDPLERVLAPGDPDRQLIIALPADAPTETLLQFAYSGYRAGYRRFAVATRRVRDGGGLGAIQFALRVPEEPLPSAGAAEVRLGRLGAYLTIEGRDGQRISEGEGIIPRLADGAIDLVRLDEHIAALTTAHPIVRVAILRSPPTLPVGTLIAIMRRLRYGDSRDRFTELQLAR